jgi:hypothetical protein
MERLGKNLTAEKNLAGRADFEQLDTEPQSCFTEIVRWRGPAARSEVGQTHVWPAKVLPSTTTVLILFFMSIAAPYTAVCVHSLWVLHREWRMDNAEIGGIYFFSRSANQHIPVYLNLLSPVFACVIAAVPTLLVLSLFRRHRIASWLAWISFVGGWTVFLFRNEFAIK